MLAGYDTAAGGTTQGNSTVGLVNGNGVVDTSTTTSLLAGNNTRGAASVDGTSVWVAGTDGVVYEADGSSGGTLVDAASNGRVNHGRALHRFANGHHPTVHVDG